MSAPARSAALDRRPKARSRRATAAKSPNVRLPTRFREVRITVFSLRVIGSDRFDAKKASNKIHSWWVSVRWNAVENGRAAGSAEGRRAQDSWDEHQAR